MSNSSAQYERALQRVLDSEIPDDILSRSMTASLAPSIASKCYKTIPSSLGQFLASTLNHQPGDKEGSAILPGTLKAPDRKEGNVTLLTAVVFDVDGGEDIENTRCKLEKAGWVYSLHTTHSDGKALTTVPVADFVSKVGLADESDISLDLLDRYLSEHRGYAAAISSTIEGFNLECDKTGRRLVRIQHGPIRKFRIVIPLEEPFAPGGYPSLTEAKRAWAGYLEAVAQALELDFDRACVDLSRAFFRPRHPRGRPFEVHVGGRRLLNLDEITLVERQHKGRRPMAAPLRERGSNPMSAIESANARPWLRDYLRRKGRSLDIVGWLTEEIGWETRGKPTDVKATILCPNDDAHSNPGDLDDTACVAINPGTANYRSAIITCRHQHCQHLRTPDFLNMILDQIDIQGPNA